MQLNPYLNFDGQYADMLVDRFGITWIINREHGD
jgi:hypothetical protein